MSGHPTYQGLGRFPASAADLVRPELVTTGERHCWPFCRMAVSSDLALDR